MGDPVWARRALCESDLPALSALVRRCLETDGGLPDAASEPFIRRMYLSGPGIGEFAEHGALIGAAALGDPGRGGRLPAAGAVDPRYRGQGIGRSLLDWTVAAAAGQPLLVGSESVSESAEHLYARYGVQQVFAELVMRADLLEFGRVEPPGGIELRQWSSDRAPSFFAAYTAAFRERPGFPGWSEQQWIDWTTDDEDFAPELSLLAVPTGAGPSSDAAGNAACGPSGAAAGFVIVGAIWIVQMGVVPRWRRQGLGAALLRAAMSGIAAAGYDACWLNVATNNPSAERLYRGAGFAAVGRRARYAAD